MKGYTIAWEVASNGRLTYNQNAARYNKMPAAAYSDITIQDKSGSGVKLIKKYEIGENLKMAISA